VRGSGEGGGVGGLILPVDTPNQVVCLAGQTDDHSSPDHTTSRADVEWNRIDPQTTLLMPHRVCFGLSLLDRVGKMPSVKEDLLIYSNFATVCYYNNTEWISILCCVHEGFSQIQSHLHCTCSNMLLYLIFYVSLNYKGSEIIR